MTALDRRTRERLFGRDHGQCVACGTPYGLTPQHRANRGMGGSKTANGLSNLLTMCSLHNGQLEADEVFAELGREKGWKVHRNRVTPPAAVPVWYAPEAAWFHIEDDGSRLRIEAPTTEVGASDIREEEDDGHRDEPDRLLA